jgi:hypothetical protein
MCESAESTCQELLSFVTESPSVLIVVMRTFVTDSKKFILYKCWGMTSCAKSPLAMYIEAMVALAIKLAKHRNREAVVTLIHQLVFIDKSYAFLRPC